MSKAKRNLAHSPSARTIEGPAAIGRHLQRVLPLTDMVTCRTAEPSVESMMQDRAEVLGRLVVLSEPKTLDDALAQVIVAGGRAVSAIETAASCDDAGLRQHLESAVSDLLRMLYGVSGFLKTSGATIGAEVRENYLPDRLNPYAIECAALARAAE